MTQQGNGTNKGGKACPAPLLIALFERCVGLYAGLIRVNAYHQPGVEAGKKAAAAVLALERRLLVALRERGAGWATAAELATAVGAPEEVETALLLLERLAANRGRGVVRRAGARPWDARFSWER